jgi:mRNA-degrading endonuclease toxin of MazEF toxin-antitoxin module
VVQIPGGAAGLTKTSVAVCHQVTTLDRVKLIKRVGALTSALMQEVEAGLKTAMDLD